MLITGTHAAWTACFGASLKGFVCYARHVNDELHVSLRELPPAEMRERAIDYMLMAEEADSEQTRKTFLRVATRLEELAREATAASLERRGTSPPVPAGSPSEA